MRGKARRAFAGLVRCLARGKRRTSGKFWMEGDSGHCLAGSGKPYSKQSVRACDESVRRFRFPMRKKEWMKDLDFSLPDDLL